MFDFLKALSNLPQKIAQEREKRDRTLTLTAEDLAALDDESLREAVTVRIEAALDAALGNDPAETSAEIAALPLPQRAFYVLDLYEAEVNNGGLCQFFVNSSKAAAPLVGDFLHLVGADAHRDLYLHFLEDHEIDPARLAKFQPNKYAELCRRYPFERFDRAFCDLPPIETNLLAFVRKHPERF